MKAIWTYLAVAAALVAGSLCAIPVHAHVPGTPTVRPAPPPPPPPPPISVPRINPRDAVPTVSRPPTSVPTPSVRPPSSGGPATLPVRTETPYVIGTGDSLSVGTFNRPLTPDAAAGKKADEMVRYNEGDPNHNYRAVTDPNNASWNQEPWREQNCVGLVLEKKYGIQNAVVDADTFYQKVLVGMDVPVIDKADVADGDIGIMFYEGGKAGHAFYVQKVEGTGSDKTITIQSKDQWERTRQGVLTEGDDVHKAYRGDIKFFRIDPVTHQLVPKK